MSHTAAARRPGWKKRTLSLFLTAVMLLGMVPAVTLTPAQAHWADPYLDQMVEWGYMRADQAADPNAPMTRADFMAVVNRAYGYHETGPIPFDDVQPTDWFYDDVRIAYTARYISGTSENTASPNDPLNRETVIFILGKNMMLQESPGESLAFADSRETSSWSRGMVKSAVDHYLVAGYEDNTFRPKNSVSRGEMAVLLSQCIGTPVQEAGTYELGDVFGNVTITAPGVTLRNTVIAGDLYITGGVGLGDIKLENITVLGRIIASGTGESEQGDASIVMRNVEADEMLVDNLRNQFVTIRSEGLTEIAKTTVRTPTYLEDNTPDDAGLRTITLEDGGRLDLAGRIKEVTNKDPGSVINVAKGTVETLTVDEAATNSQVQVAQGSVIKVLNLDIGTTVSGQGDVTLANINAPGSTLSMLPEKITIRPGLTASVAGQVMDSAAAEEASRDPMILSGYPLANNVAPTSLDAVFAANKRGTIYWAISPITDGSVGADDLISPPAYGSIAERSGSVTTPSADTLVQSQVTELTSGGSYYLSAILVDGREARSPVKVTAFTTPDDSVPAFADNYPYMSLITDTMAQVTVMSTKSCKMYYAVLPAGGTAPTPAELRSASVVGNLGYGVIDVVKNTEHSLTVSRQLEELKDYVLYLWLTDANGANSSAVESIEFTTVDRTPPEFVIDPYVNQVQATSVRLAFTINEPATVFWAVVEEGTVYPKPQPGGLTDDRGAAPLDSEYARLQVASGMNALLSGSVDVAQANNEATMNITGLEGEKSYDLYYVARDTAGNYSVRVEKITIHTLDQSGPRVTQYFTEYSGLDNTQDPLPSTDIVLEFNENIRCINDGEGGVDFLTLAADLDPNRLINALRNSITLWQETSTGRVQQVDEYNPDDPDQPWVINYANATVSSEGGKVRVTFPTKDEPSQSALNLASGASYYFEIRDLTDNATEQNPITPNPLNYSVAGAELHTIPRFTTIFAQVFMSDPGVGAADAPVRQGDTTKGAARVDLSFRLAPESTQKAESSNSYDILLYTDTSVEYELYYRVLDSNSQPIRDPLNDPRSRDYLLPVKAANKKADANGWFYMGSSGAVNPSTGNEWAGRSINQVFNGCDATSFPALNRLSEDLSYDFVITLTKYGSYTDTDYATWNGPVNFEVHVLAGPSNRLNTLAVNPNKTNLQSFIDRGLNNGGGVSIGTTNRSENFLALYQEFTDSRVPQFYNNPTFDVGDTFATMHLTLDRAGTIYYVVAPWGGIGTEMTGITNSDDVWDALPLSGQNWKTVIKPVSDDIFNPAPYRRFITGTIPYEGGFSEWDEVLSARTGKALMPLTDYCVYFVLKGVSDPLSPVYAYRFTTTDISRPKIVLTDNTDGSVNVSTQVPAAVNYILFNLTDANSRITWLVDGLLESYLGTYTDENGTTQTKVLPTAYRGMTLLEALQQRYSYSNAQGTTGAYYPVIGAADYDDYSVFDVYASDAIKTRVANLARNGDNRNGTDIINMGSVTTEDSGDGKTFTADAQLPNMKTEGEYLFISVGYHTSSAPTVGDSFRAVYPVVKLDTEAPELTRFDFAFSRHSGKNPNYRFTGSVTFTFNKDVYYAPSRGSSSGLMAVYQTSADTDTAISILSHLGVNAAGVANASVTVDPNREYPTSSFTLNFTNLPIGSVLTLFDTGSISNSRGQQTDKKLYITLKQDIGYNDANMPIHNVYFEAHWSDEEGGGTAFPTTSSSYSFLESTAP